MPTTTPSRTTRFRRAQDPASLSLHGLGVICGLAAGVWLGAAEAPHQARLHRPQPLPRLALHGRRRLHRPLDLPHPAQGHQLRLRRPRQQKTPYCLGAPRRLPLGRRQHPHRLRHPRRRPLHRLPPLERQLPSSASSGDESSSARLKGASRPVIARKILLGATRSPSAAAIHARLQQPSTAGGQNGAAPARPRPSKASSPPSEPAVMWGHHVRPLPQGLPQRHEPPLLRHPPSPLANSASWSSLLAIVPRRRHPRPASPNSSTPSTPASSSGSSSADSSGSSAISSSSSPPSISASAAASLSPTPTSSGASPGAASSSASSPLPTPAHRLYVLTGSVLMLLGALAISNRRRLTQ